MSELESYGESTEYSPPSRELDEITDLLVASGHAVDRKSDDLSAYVPSSASGMDVDDVFEGYRQAAEESARRSKGSQAGDDDDSAPSYDDYEARPQRQHAPPTRWDTPQDIANALAFIGQVPDRLNAELAAGRITQAQWQMGMQTAAGASLEVQARIVQLDRQIQQQEDAERQYHDTLSASIPGWNDRHQRKEIIADMRSFFGQFGVPAEAMHGYLPPAAVIAAKRMMTEMRRLKGAESKRLAKINAQRRESRAMAKEIERSKGRPSVQTQTMQVARLLAGVK